MLLKDIDKRFDQKDTEIMHLNNWCAEDRHRIRELENDVTRRDEQITQILNLITKHRQCLENIVNRIEELEGLVGYHALRLEWQKDRLCALEERQKPSVKPLYNNWINDYEEEPEIDQDVIIMNERDDSIVVANATYEGEYLYRVYDKDFGSKFVECDGWMPRGEDE